MTPGLINSYNFIHICSLARDHMRSNQKVLTLNNTIVEIDHRKYVSLHSYQYLSTINKVLIFITILSTTHIGGPPSWYNTLFGFVFRFHRNSNLTVVPT